MATLLGALRGYFGAMAAAQGAKFLSTVAARTGDPLPDRWDNYVRELIDAGARDAANIAAEIAAAKVGMTDADGIKMLDDVSAAVLAVQAETESLGTGTMGATLKAGPLGPAIAAMEWAANWAAAAETAVAGTTVSASRPVWPMLKRALAWILGIGAGAGVGLLLYRAWERTDPLYSIKMAYEGSALLQAKRDQEVSACGGDEECRARAKARADKFASYLDNSLIDDSSGGCGMLDTPTGTLIGAMVGIGFGWSGMRRLMRS